MPTHSSARSGLPSLTCPWWSIAPYTPHDSTAPIANVSQLMITPVKKTPRNALTHLGVDSSVVIRFARAQSQNYVTEFPGGASRLAALLLPQILPVFLVVAPCQPGAALRDFRNVVLTLDTS